jgi:hypothetical protein
MMPTCAILSMNVGILGLDLDRHRVDLADVLHRDEVAAQVRALVVRALEREHDVVGAERGAVLPLHIRAQLDAPQSRRWVRPFGRQRRLELQVAVAADQRLVDVGEEGEQERFIAGVWVHRVDVAVIGPFEHLRVDRDRGCGHGKTREQCDDW